MALQLTLLAVLLGIINSWNAGEGSTLAAVTLAAYGLMTFGGILWARLKAATHRRG